jgi:hypothetical protein
VRYEDLHEACRRNEYDCIHYATHMAAGPDKLDELSLSNSETVDLSEAALLSKMSGAKLVFFNLCLAARFGSYLVQHGTPAVIYTTVEIADDTAWSTPVAFYDRCRRGELAGHAIDYREVLESVDSGTGYYGWAVGTSYYGSLLRPMREAIDEIKKQILTILTTLEHHGELLGIAQPVSMLRSRFTWWVLAGFGLLMLLSSAIVTIGALYDWLA